MLVLLSKGTWCVFEFKGTLEFESVSTQSCKGNCCCNRERFEVLFDLVCSEKNSFVVCT